MELEGSFGLVSSPTQWVELIEWWNLTSFECVLDIESVNVFGSNHEGESGSCYKKSSFTVALKRSDNNV